MQCSCLLFLSLTAFVGLSYAEESLVLELSANNVTAGEQLNASCTAPTNTTGRTLHINGVPVTDFIMPQNRSTSISSGVTTTWTIDPVEPGDAGVYVCVAGDQTPVSDSENQAVTVYFAPIFSHNELEQENGTSINITAVENSDIVINCNVSASNPNVIMLTLAKPSANNTNFDNGTGAISITNVTSDNAGTYTCTADNGVTMPTTISFVLMVTDAAPSSTSSVQVTPEPATSMLPSTIMLTTTSEMPQFTQMLPQPSSTMVSQTPPTTDDARTLVAATVVIAVNLLVILFLS